MRVQILEEALEDLDQGFRFYEGQEAGLGSYFLDELFSDIDSLRNSAGIHPLSFSHHRAHKNEIRIGGNQAALLARRARTIRMGGAGWLE